MNGLVNEPDDDRPFNLTAEVNLLDDEGEDEPSNGITDSTTDGDELTDSWLGLDALSAATGVTLVALLAAESCNLRVCFLRSKLRQNPLPQMRQVKGFFSLCVCMWKVRL